MESRGTDSWKRHGAGVPSLLDVRSHFQGTFRPWDTRIFQARSMHSCAHHCSLPSPHPVLGGTRMRSSRTVQRNHLWSVRRLERRKRFHATNCHSSGMGPFPHEELPLFQYLSSHVARTWGQAPPPPLSLSSCSWPTASILVNLVVGSQMFISVI